MKPPLQPTARNGLFFKAFDSHALISHNDSRLVQTYFVYTQITSETEMQIKAIEII